MDPNFLSLIISSVLTIIGWFVAAWWAVKQVNIAHDKNRALQQEILVQAIKDNLYKEFIDLYSDIAESSIGLMYALNMVALNMALDEHKADIKTESTLKFGWIDLFDKVNQGYASFTKDVDRLETWLDATSEFMPNSADLYKIIDAYKKDFTMADGRATNIWSILQTTFAGIRVKNEANIKQYQSAMGPVGQSLINIRSQLKKCAKTVQRCLVTRSIDTIMPA